MKRNTMLKILNPILGILMASQMLTGIFGSSLSSEAFEIMHKDGGFLLAGVAGLHLILNWSWVKTNFFKRTSAVRV